MLQAIIIEDNPAADQHLRELLPEISPNIRVVGSAASVVAGAKLLQQQAADLLFLDIELPDGTGFDLLDILGDWPGAIIFVTGLDQHALRAFRYAAVDYLLKPITQPQLQEAVQRALPLAGGHNRIAQRELLQTVSQRQQQSFRIAVHAQDSIRILEVEELVYLEAESNYTTFYLADGKRLVVGKTLKTYDELLAEHNFLRVHQSYLVNPRYLKEFVRTDGGFLRLSTGAQIPVSVRRRQLVMDYLQQL